jgi:hypothetical protein
MIEENCKQLLWNVTSCYALLHVRGVTLFCRDFNNLTNLLRLLHLFRVRLGFFNKIGYFRGFWGFSIEIFRYRAKQA